MDRRQFLAGATLAAVAIAGCTSTQAQEDQPTRIGGAPDAEPDHTIAVSANGEVETEPDRASLRTGIEATGEDAAAVESTLSDRSAELRDALEAAGVDDENVESGRFSVRPIRDENGFRGSHEFRITIEDVDQVGEVIDAAIEAGAENVGRIRFDLSDRKRADLRDDAVDHALENADDEARHLASNRGVSITGTTALETRNVDVDPIRAEVDHEVAEDDVADDSVDAGGRQHTEIESGLVSVRARVEVTYGFEE